MADCLVSLGSNLDDRAALLDAAAARLAAHCGIRDWRESRRLETAPVGGPPGQPTFLNSVARFQSSLAPLELLRTLQQVEHELGRVRHERWSARRIDLDLLLVGDQTSATTELELPHPRLAFRRFVLEPAAEIAADMRHPTIGWTIGRLLDHLNRAPDYLALAGGDAHRRRALAREAAAALGARLVTRTPCALSLLSSESPNVVSSPATDDVWIADFWSGDEASDALPEAWSDDASAAVRSAPLSDAPPKLLVRLGTLASASASYEGPVLDLANVDPARALAEIVAAATAMRRS